MTTHFTMPHFMTHVCH